MTRVLTLASAKASSGKLAAAPNATPNFAEFAIKSRLDDEFFITAPL